jgi:ABC-type antimicrobial peptide transport system permease subunit
MPLQSALSAASGGLPVGKVRMMDDLRARSILDYEFAARLLTIFGAAALLLSAIGIYGVMAYSVQLQTREIGIRLALGARAQTLRNRVVTEAMRLALMGAGAGIAAAFGLSRFLASLLYGVERVDPVAFTAAALLLCAVALVAAYVPARRASRVNPMDAIRHE